MSLDEKVDQAVNRLSEFYDKEDLEYFYNFVGKNKLPFYKSFLFLDGQTRADYYVSQQKPKIWEYMERTKQFYKSGGFDK